MLKFLPDSNDQFLLKECRNNPLKMS
jgi:hypothetical protein